MSEQVAPLPRLVGSTPPTEARPVSLAAHHYLEARLKESDLNAEAEGALGVAVAVSGGADSLALAVALGDVAQRRNIPLVAFIVDHGMRDGADEQAAQVSAYLSHLGFGEVEVLSGPVWSKHELPSSPEGYARELRYRLLTAHAGRWGAQRGLARVELALGHTLDDQAETVLLRLARGAGTRSLAAIAPQNEPQTVDGVAVTRVRPLLGVRRKDTWGFCRALGLHVFADPADHLEDGWRTKDGKLLPRLALRTQVLPKLNEALGQDVSAALARSAQIAKEDESALRFLSQRVFQTHSQAEPGRVDIGLEAFRDQPAAIRKRVFQEAAQAVADLTLTQAQLDQLDRLTTAQNGAGQRSHTVFLPLGFRGFCTDTTFVIARDEWGSV